MTATVTEEGHVSAETIIISYKAGKAAGVATYDKLCKAVDTLEHWKPEGVVQFVQQFLDIGHLLDVNCKAFVKKLAQIDWKLIPSEIRPRFVDLLRGVAVQHVCHTDVIVGCFVENLLAKTHVVAAPVDEAVPESSTNRLPKVELALPVEEQDAIYKLAHDGIAFVLRCYPMSSRLLEKSMRRHFPHHSSPLHRYTSFVRNALLITEYATDVSAEVWSLIIDSCAQIDAMITKQSVTTITEEEEENSNDSSGIFVMDDLNETTPADSQPKEGTNWDRIQKLDGSLSMVLGYITKSHGAEIPLDVADKLTWLLETCPSEILYMHVRAAFERHVLMAGDVKNVPFVWFYLCSLDSGYARNFFQWLWSFVERPSQSPNEWKKAHGAVCYLGSFLSRASFVDLRVCMEWLNRLTAWCTRYVNEMVGSNTVAGTLRHGTFYAVCQAVLVTFCFRYSEIVDAGELTTVRNWGLGHILHSALEPLRYVDRAAALCFATISRSLQLVYCNHILSYSTDEEESPFESYFPFDSCSLPQSSRYVAHLGRRFSPLAEDVGVLARELRWHNASSLSGAMGFRENDGKPSAGSLDFLDDLDRDREIFSELDRQEALTMFSTSPGLGHFITKSSFMDTN